MKLHEELQAAPPAHPSWQGGHLTQRIRRRPTVAAFLAGVVLAGSAADAVAATWVRILEDARPRGSEGGVAIATRDGGWLVAASAWLDGGMPQLLLHRLDGAGAVKSEALIGHSWEDLAVWAVEEKCDGFLMGGAGYLGGTNGGPMLLFVDEELTPVWSLVYLTERVRYGPAVRRHPDGGFVFAGYSGNDPLSSSNDAVALVIRDDGSVATALKFDQSADRDAFRDVAIRANGSMLLAGSADSATEPNHGWLIDLAADGAVRWAREYAPTGGSAVIEHVAATSDGGALLFVFANDYAPNDWSLVVAKVGPTGDIQSQEAFADFGSSSGDEYALAVQADGRIAWVGTNRPGFPVDDDYGALLVYSDDGTLLQSRRVAVSPVRGDSLGGVVPAPDGGLLLTGATWHDSRGEDILVVKLDEQYLAGSACSLVYPHDHAPDDLTLVALASTATATPISVVAMPRSWEISPLPVADRDACPLEGCVPASSEILDVEPGRVVCVGTQVDVEGAAGGEGSLTVEWDFDYTCGDFTNDATGSTGSVTYSTTGERFVALRVTDSCGIREQQVLATVTVRVVDCTNPPGEVSDVRAGAVAMLPSRDGRLLFEERNDTTAYNVLHGTIGAWPSGAPAETAACTLRSWDSRSGGWAEVRHDPPLGSWFVVSASNGAGEGPAGRDSQGRDRPLTTSCGSAP